MFKIFLFLTFCRGKIVVGEKRQQKERQLSVFPSYNEINDVDEYIRNLKSILSRIKNMRKDLQDIQNQAKHDVDYIVSKIDNRLQDDAYDDLLNQIFYKKLNKK